jgi:type I restriction enzyme S subunit
MNNWKTDKLKSLGYFQYGYTATATKINSGVKYLRISDIPDTGKINWQTVPFCKIPDNDFSKYSLINGDVLFARIGATAGKTCYIESAPKSIFASYLIRFVTNELDSKFFFYFTQSPQYWKQALQKREGQLKKGLNANTLSNFNIQYPENKLEQAAIVNILSTVDEAIQKADEAITKTERIKQAMMQKLLTEGIGHREFKQTKIGKIPKEWEIITLSKICKLIRENYEPQRNGSLPFIGLEHITSGAFYTDKYGIESDVTSSKSKFSSGDILYGKLRPYLDKVAISRVEGISSTDVLVITPQKNLSISAYLLLVLHSKRFINFSIARTSGTNHPRVNWKDISKFTIGLPPIEEQKKIASIILDLQQKLELANQRKKKLGTIKLGLMDDLLTGKKRLNIN